MIRGNEVDERIYEEAHIQQVLVEIECNLPKYIETFSASPLDLVFKEHIREYQKERDAYQSYLDLEALEEFSLDPNAFKNHTRKYCPIIRRCLNSQDEVMKQYKQSFNAVSGRELLDAVRNIAEFGRDYVDQFRDQSHEAASSPSDLGLDLLNDKKYGATGVIGYGVQSSLLYGLNCREFAHRSQNAVWALYFLSNRKDFDLEDGSEFLMVHANEGTVEQNYFYPAQLFGFYSLRVFQMLKAACKELGIDLFDSYRYIYLSAFCDHIGDIHRDDIQTYKWSSEHVESRPWF
jgi:hypothetical protein